MSTQFNKELYDAFRAINTPEELASAAARSVAEDNTLAGGQADSMREDLRRVESKLSAEIHSLDEKLSGEIHNLDAKLSAEIRGLAQSTASLKATVSATNKIVLIILAGIIGLFLKSF